MHHLAERFSASLFLPTDLSTQMIQLNPLATTSQECTGEHTYTTLHSTYTTLLAVFP